MWRWIKSWFAKPKKDRGSFYRSKAWVRLREITKKENRAWYGRPKPTCERCGARPDHWWPKKRRPIHVDHVKPRSRFPKYQLDGRYTQCLCNLCNVTKGARTTWHWKRMRRWGLIYAPFRISLLWYQRIFQGWGV